MSVRIALVAVFLLLVAGLAAAESVMVSVRPDRSYPESERLGFYLSGVEAGVMDVLFDSGHIVFNRAGGEEVSSTAQVVEIAVNGGAGYVVDAVVLFAPEGDGLRVRAVEYSWLRLGSGMAPRSDRLEASALPEGEQGGTAEQGYRLGRRVGLIVAENMR